MDERVPPRSALELFIEQGFPEATTFEGRSLSAAQFTARLIRVLPAEEAFLTEGQRRALLAHVSYEDDDPPQIVTFNDAATILCLYYHDAESAAHTHIEGLRSMQPLAAVPPGGRYPGI